MTSSNIQSLAFREPWNLNGSVKVSSKQQSGKLNLINVTEGRYLGIVFAKRSSMFFLKFDVRKNDKTHPHGVYESIIHPAVHTYTFMSCRDNQFKSFGGYWIAL